MTRPVTRLTDLVIDEVSTVDRDANGKAKIAFAKRAGDGDGPSTEEASRMGVRDEYFDAGGAPVDVEQLQPGDRVYDADGGEFVFTADDQVDERELAGAGVGKSLADRLSGIRKARGTRVETGRRVAGRAPVGKSAGALVLEQLSKAVSEGDREQVIAKAVDRIAAVEAENVEIRKALEAERDTRLERDFVSKAAAEFGHLPAEEVGPVLKSLYTGVPLTDEQVALVEDIFKAAGDPAMFDELGVAGGAAPTIFDEVSVLAGEHVAKSGGGFSTEEATSAFFEQNPNAYDEYLRGDGR